MTTELILSDGRKVTIKDGKGKNLLNAQKIAKAPDEIPYALLAELCDFDGQQLVYEDFGEVSIVPAECIIHLSKTTGWTYTEICQMSLYTLDFWVNEAVKYTQKRNELIEESLQDD